MISNQILQSTVEGLKQISRVELGIIDTEGNVLAATFPEATDFSESARIFVNSPADSQEVQGYQFFKVYDEAQLEYVLLASGSTEDTYMIGKMAAFQIQGLLVAYKERFDKDNFIKNLLLDNLLLIDIYNRAKKLHINTDSRRVVFILETNHEKDTVSMESVRTNMGNKPGDFITAVDEKSITGADCKDDHQQSGFRIEGSGTCSLRNGSERDQRSIQILQGGAHGTGCRQDILR